MKALLIALIVLKSATISTALHCENCAKKVRENISYCKGVKDLDVSLKDQKITVTFDAAKTSEQTLCAEIQKLGYKAEVIEVKEVTKDSKKRK